MNKKVFFGAGAASLASTATSVLLLALLLQPAGAAAAETAGDASVERGRYVVRTSGCNDCHTAGYLENSGKVPESEWLKGQSTGYRGPWGTTYPANLRLTVGSMSEDQWVTFARAERLPPMPWFNVRVMKEADLRAMYRYIRFLGAAGERAPAPLPPGKEGSLPFISFMPQTPPLARQR